MRERGSAIPAAAALVLALEAGARAAEPARAEYAARWDPARGGPATAAEVAVILGAEASARHSCEVLYYDLPRPSGAPAGAAVILRRRSCDDGATEIRLKYRSAHPFEDRACPAGAPFHPATEVDVDFGEGAPSRVYSFSCTLSAAQPPAFLRAVPKPCVSRMTRSETHGGDGARWKIEDWTLPDGSRRLEVSRTAGNDVDALAAFGTIVERLRARGARLLDESKTELGGRCPSGGAR
ncbi:MAG: hypothetical protein ACM3NW_12215 [Syntrophomonadaceae bacterium]